MAKVNMNKEFPIISVTREMLDDAGISVCRVTDSDMRELADRLAKDYRENLFWQSLEIIACDVMGIPKKRIKL